MTLLEIAQYACSKINQTDAGDLLAAKNFCRRQFTLIWQSQLWKDSLIEFTQTLGVAADYVVTDTWLPTKQILLCPTILSHVIAVRNADRKFNVQSSELFYCQDFDQFQNSGTAVDYRLLSPCVWEFESEEAAYRMNESSADAATVTVQIVNGMDLSSATDQAFTAERIDAVSKAVTTARVSIVAPVPCLTVANATGQTILVTVDSTDNAAGTAIATGNSAAIVADVGQTIRVYNTATPLALPFYNDVAAFGTLTFDGAFNGSFVATPFSVGIAVLNAADTNAAKRQRLQLIGAIESGMVLRVLGKRTCPTFTADTDEPGLTGVENALMALTHADMLERERHYGQAKLIFDKAGVMMEVLVKEQTAQQAHQKRIIPSDGFGNPFGFDGLLGTKTNP